MLRSFAARRNRFESIMRLRLGVPSPCFEQTSLLSGKFRRRLCRNLRRLLRRRFPYRHFLRNGLLHCGPFSRQSTWRSSWPLFSALAVPPFAAPHGTPPTASSWPLKSPSGQQRSSSGACPWWVPAWRRVRRSHQLTGCGVRRSVCRCGVIVVQNR